MSDIAQYLKQLREEQGWSLGQLANRTKTATNPKGLSTGFLSQIETGERNPGCDTLLVLAQVYRMHHDVLLRRAGLLPADWPTTPESEIEFDLWLRINCHYCGEALRMGVSQMHAMESIPCPRCQKINAVTLKGLAQLRARWESLRPQLETTAAGDGDGEAAAALPLPESSP